MNTIKLTSILDPQRNYVVSTEAKGSGTKKVVFFSPNNDYVVGIYKKKPDKLFMERLRDIVGRYRSGLFQNEGGNVWATRFCWPYDIVCTPQKGNIGIVMPLYSSDFLFKEGNLKGVEKKGNFFTKPDVRNCIAPSEAGDWRGMLLCSFDLARTVRRLHAAGLCHSDLSYNNVLLNPTKGKIQLIDVDELVVPGKYPAGVYGTTWFIAPEMVMNPTVSPSQQTDLHSLACLIYLYLLRRHPLQGKKVFSTDQNEDDLIQQGRGALFVEDSKDASNRPEIEGYKPVDWSDVNSLPYSAVAGPYLSPLIKRAFEDGLFDPSKRPTASEWENALWKTYERLTPCSNPGCLEHYFVLNRTKTCPFCRRPLQYTVPIFDVHHKRREEWYFVKAQVYGTDKKSMHKWHFFDNVYFSETIRKEDMDTVANVWIDSGLWYFYNKSLGNIIVSDGGTEKPLAIGQYCQLKAGMEIRNEADHGVMLKVKFI